MSSRLEIHFSQSSGAQLSNASVFGAEQIPCSDQLPAQNYPARETTSFNSCDFGWEWFFSRAPSRAFNSAFSDSSVRTFGSSLGSPPTLPRFHPLCRNVFIVRTPPEDAPPLARSAVYHPRPHCVSIPWWARRNFL